jgi:hypothetical protein
VERKSWTVDVDGAQHAVVLNWTYYRGGRQVTVDGQVVDESTVPMRWKSEQAFTVAGHPATVRTKPAGRVSPYFVITLEVDGKPVTPDPGTPARWERT